MFESLPAVFLITKDYEASCRFYTETLELKEASRTKDHVRYDLGGTSLVIHAPIRDEEMRKWNLEPLREPRGSGVVVTLTPEDVDRVHDVLVEKGADIICPPRDAPWGVRMFMLKDPNGFLIEVSKPLPGGGC
ncbi:MAG: VOC family protein [Nitrospinae bacterium]|nr:VOC family protein [Nitrospinota bacterium]